MDKDESKSNDVSHKPETLWNNQHFIQLNEQLQVFFENQQYCDVTIVSSDEKYKVGAHRILLASVSKYFLKMFEEEKFTESTSDHIKLHLFEGHTLKSILSFIYKGIIELTADTVEYILIGSHIMELGPLEKLCCDYMKKNIEVSNCLGILEFADRYKYDDLKEAAMICACENFAFLKDEEEFKTRSIDQLCAIIARDDLRAPSEADVFYCILAWIDNDKNERKQFLNRLLNYIRFPLLSVNIIGGIIDELGESIETLRIVCKAYAWHASPIWQSTIFPREQSKIRNFKDVIVAISGFTQTENSLCVGLYYSGLKEWIFTKWPGIPHSRTFSDLKFTVLNKKLIFVGGIMQNNQYSNRVDFLDLESLEWSRYPDLTLSEQNSKVAIMAMNGSLWCGASGIHSINKLEKPFKQWQLIDVARRSDQYSRGSNNMKELTQVLALGIFATHKDKIYFPEQFNYITYSVTDNTFETTEIVRQVPSLNSYQPQQPLESIVGVHIVRNIGMDFLVEITRNFAFIYNLETKTRLVHNILFDSSCNKTALHGKNIIIYGPNKIYVYDFYSNKLQSLPPLCNNFQTNFILLTDSEKEDM